MEKNTEEKKNEEDETKNTEELENTEKAENIEETDKTDNEPISIEMGIVNEVVYESVEYDPHFHRVAKYSTGYWVTLVHMIKGSLGTGILAMPNGFRHAGFVNGFFGTLCIGCFLCYTIHTLVRSQYILCKRKRVGLLIYSKSMEAALLEGPLFLRKFAKLACKLTTVFLATYQVGICCVYVLFIASNLKEVVDHSAEFHIALHVLYLIVPLYLLGNITSLKVMAPFSMVANVLTFIGLGIVISYCVTDMPDISTRNATGDISKFPLFIGTVLFAIEAIGVVVALENNMHRPSDFVSNFGVLNVGMFFIVLFYAIIGLLGYLKYGEESRGSITLVVPEEPLSDTGKMLYVISILISYSLQVYVPIFIATQFLERRFADSEYLNYYDKIVKAGIVLITALCASTIPNLGAFISLVGSIFLPVLGIIFPALMELCTLWPTNYGQYDYIYYKDLVIMLLGFMCFGAGIITSFDELG